MSVDPSTKLETSDCKEESPKHHSSAKGKNVIVCWDFDWSLVNENTDHYVHQKLYGEREYARRFPLLAQKAAEEGSTVFTDFQDKYGWPQLFGDFQLDPRSFGAELADLPIFPQNLDIVATVDRHGQSNNNGLATFNINQYILSNANQVLIDVVLTANGLKNVFKNDQIWTNPGWFDPETGTLRVQRYHNVIPQTADGVVRNPHRCGLCAANLCKGKVLREELLPRHDPARRRHGHFENQVIYIGDGANDFCAVRSLKEGDVAMVRRFEQCKGLEAKVDAHKSSVRCHVLKWSDGKELKAHFKKVVPGLRFADETDE